MARLRFRLKVDGLADDALMVHKYQGVESLSNRCRTASSMVSIVMVFVTRYNLPAAALDLVDKTATQTSLSSPVAPITQPTNRLTLFQSTKPKRFCAVKVTRVKDLTN